MAKSRKRSRDHPILFTPWSVPRILTGYKTQTRRVVKGAVSPDNLKVVGDMFYHRPEDRDGVPVLDEWREWKPVADCPHGAVTDQLWVREAWRVHDDYNGIGDTSTCAEVEYQADNARIWQDIPESKQAEWFYKLTPWVNSSDPPWCKSMFMPRWASRVTLELDEVRVERLQDISWDDAIAEGIEEQPEGSGWYHGPTSSWRSPISAYAELWDGVGVRRGHASQGQGWEVNPWVSALTFHVVERRDS